ncbi:MAG: DUF4147 domain-containing protein [Methylomonas sp.]|jgi:hydroxypyruvate reductase
MPLSRVSLRALAITLFQSGVAAADPYQAVKTCLKADEKSVYISLDRLDSSLQRTGGWRRIHLIAFGKAACAMAYAAQEIIPARLRHEKGVAVTTYENVCSVENFQVLGAGHPWPDAAGLHAARQIAERAQQARNGDLLLVLISGGGSALLPLPVDGVSLADKIETTGLLLASGANINEINCVRKHLSRLKGGGLAKLAAQADLHALILSDVPDNDISSIASGPTAPDPSLYIDAIGVLKSYRVWEQAPASVRNYLDLGADGFYPETPKPGADFFHNKSYTLIGSNAISVDSVLNCAKMHGFAPDLYNKQLCGEARRAAEELAFYAKKLQTAGLKQAIAVISGGETTVTLCAGSGKGGRNQESALAFAYAAEKCGLTGDWTFLSAGTDGRDGPTDAAGGIVDNETLARIRESGGQPELMLDRHDAYPALQAAGDLLITGATGTNVADLQILLLPPTCE